MCAEFGVSPGRRVQPKGSCHRFLSLFEKSGVRRVGTKTSRSATLLNKRPPTRALFQKLRRATLMKNLRF